MGKLFQSRGVEEKPPRPCTVLGAASFFTSSFTSCEVSQTEIVGVTSIQEIEEVALLSGLLANTK